MTLSDMTDRAVAKGMNRIDAVNRLHEGFARHAGDNLVSYLVYWGFATEAKAEIVAAEYDARIASL